MEVLVRVLAGRPGGGEPQQVLSQTAAQLQSLDRALVLKQGLFDCLPPAVSFSVIQLSIAESKIRLLEHDTYLNTIRVALSASTRERQVPRTGKISMMRKIILLKLRRVGKTVREMILS